MKRLVPIFAAVVVVAGMGASAATPLVKPMPGFQPMPVQPAIKLMPVQPAFKLMPVQPAFRLMPVQPAFRLMPVHPAFFTPVAIQRLDASSEANERG